MKSIFHQPVPELPVRDVEQAQIYYRDNLGFEIGWLIPEKTLGAISKNEAAIFLRKEGKVVPITMWIFVDNVDETYKECASRNLTIVEPLETKPWNMRQFTVKDPDGHLFIFHHDI